MIRLMEMPVSAERFILSAENLTYKELFSLIATFLLKPEPKIEAKKWMAEVYWRTQKLKSWISGKKPLVTKETSITAMSNYQYSNKKISELLDYSFIPIRQSIEEACVYHLSKK
jgi:hypothetical protein